MAADDRGSRKAVLWELARLYLRLGTTAFGGPAAHIAMMEEEVVRRRGWLTRDKFLDLLGAANLIPGPSSTEMSIYIGYRRAGWPGLIVAGVCFIVPAALLTLLLAYAYVRLGGLPQAGAVLYGVKPVIIAVVAQALSLAGSYRAQELDAHADRRCCRGSQSPWNEPSGGDRPGRNRGGVEPGER